MNALSYNSSRDIQVEENGKVDLMWNIDIYSSNLTSNHSFSEHFPLDGKFNEYLAELQQKDSYLDIA
jgi:hypothetical protein